MQPFLIPADIMTVSEEIKKSRFITYLAPTSGIEAAKSYIQQIRTEHPDARHHCWAFVAGAPSDSQQLGFSDDGEPSGTAGKPILAQLMGSHIGELTAVVVRYYGGIKLGTGGLVKAYGNGVQQALKLLPTTMKVPLTEYQLQCDYSQLATIETLVSQMGGHILQTQYGVGIDLHLAVPIMGAEELTVRLTNISRGALRLQPLS